MNAACFTCPQGPGLMPSRACCSHFLRALLLIGCWLCALNLAHAEVRVALLIGNASYNSGALHNPPNDVREMETALKAVGFKVQKLLNANQSQMKRAVRDFGSMAQGADVAMLYYSGHGTQAQGENYLIPIGAAIDKEADYEVEAVSVNSVLRQIVGAHPKAAIVVLDACRDNPYASATRGGPKGLARMDAPTGTMIAFATSPGTTASDEGYYAKVLASQITTPGLELIDVFRNTTVKVRQVSQGKQEPRISEVSITDRIYLAGGSGGSTHVASLTPELNTNQTAVVRTPSPAPSPAVDPAEAAYWAEVVRTQTEADLKAYLQTYPNGAYALKAKELLEQKEQQRRQLERSKEDQAWANAEQTNTYAAYASFISAYPSGRYTPLAKLKQSKVVPEFDMLGNWSVEYVETGGCRHTSNVLIVDRKLSNTSYAGRMDFINCAKGSVSQDAKISVNADDVTINFSNPRGSGAGAYNADNYYVKKVTNNLLKGNNRDAVGAGQAVSLTRQ